MLILANYLALALIPAVVWISVDVVRHYWPRMIRPDQPWSGEDYLIAGVIVSFLCIVGMNGIYIGASLLDTILETEMFNTSIVGYSSLVNILTRALPALLAGVLHLVAAHLYGVPGVKSAKWYVIRSVLVTGIGFILLVCMVPYD